MKQASRRFMVLAISCGLFAVAFGATAVYAAYSGNNVARHEGSHSITNAECGACHGDTLSEVSLDPAVETAHRVHLDSSLLRFDAMADGCATCHESTDIEQGSGASVNKQVDTEVCANCHGAFPSAAHDGITIMPSCSGWQCHAAGCVDCHAPGTSFDPAVVHAAVGYIDVAASSDAASCPLCHGGLALYAVTDRDPVSVLVAKATGVGGIVPSGTTAVDMGEDLAYAITPGTGQHTVDVVVDGVSVGARSSYTFSNVTTDHTISATFAPDTFAVLSSAGTNGSIAPLGSTTVEYGSASPTYVITPAQGCVVSDVVVDGVSRGALTSYRFDDVRADHAITASFKRIASLSISSSRTTVYRGQTVRYAGSIAPNVPNGTKIVLQIRAYGSSTWKTLSTRSTYSGRLWAYSYTPKTRARGTYYVRAVYAGSSSNTAAVSASKKLVIK